MVLQGSAAVEEVEGGVVAVEMMGATPWVVAGVAEGVEATVAAAVGEVRVAALRSASLSTAALACGYGTWIFK